MLADLDRDRHRIEADLWIQPGQVLVLGRNGDPAVNGGVPVAYVYDHLDLANNADELILITPWGVAADQVRWGADTGLVVPAGASLERYVHDGVVSWMPAWSTWPGSAGDKGSPGALNQPQPPTPTPTVTYTPLPNPTRRPEATATPVLMPTPTPILTVTYTALPTPTRRPEVTATPVLMPTPTPPATPPHIIISEVMADPAAVGDSVGEWFELANLDRTAVNLNGWTIADLDHDRHQIRADLWIQPGEHIVLARNGDANVNGGVQAAYVYDHFSLANTADEIILMAAWGAEVDRVSWDGERGLAVAPGVSLERTNASGPAVWAPAWSKWPGSAGDKGSPGQAYVPPPTVTPSPTSTIAPTATARVTPAAAGSATIPATVTAAGAPKPVHVLISEFMADPAAVPDSAGEWVELFNAGHEPVNLHSWILSDADRDRHVIVADLWIQPGEYRVLARNGDPAVNGGVAAAYAYDHLTLANTADELILTTPWGVEVDRIAWGGNTGITVTRGASLERASIADRPQWVTATQPWPGSAGDKGSPGVAYTPALPSPTLTGTATQLVPSPATPTLALLPTVTPTVTPSAPPAKTPHLLISELMADPSAVPDSVGEWVEIVNADKVVVNLRGWQLADLGGERHTIAADLLVAPGQYVVLARNGDAAANGGVTAGYVYAGIQLSNSADELILVAPWGVEVDRVQWGDAWGITVHAGASLERTTLDGAAQWAPAHSVWPGSTGDKGSPGQAYTPPAVPTPTPSPFVPQSWEPEAVSGPLVIDEVYYRGADGEYVVLCNASDTPLDLSGWAVGDAETPGDGEGIYALPDGQILAPHQLFVIARRGAAFTAAWGRAPDAEFEETDPSITNLARRSDLAKGRWALDDGGDEVVLLDPTLHLADVVVFAGGDYAALQVSGDLRPATAYSIQRVPGFRFPATRDLRQRFLFAPPAPFQARTLPIAQAHDLPSLAGGMMAVWGSLGAYSNFSVGGTAPPHYLLAAAGAAGLDYVAIADLGRAPAALDMAAAGTDVIALPAWRWQSGQDAAAVIYNGDPAALGSWQELRDYLAARGSVAQTEAGAGPLDAGFAAIAADTIVAPGSLQALYAAWSAAGRVAFAGRERQPAVARCDRSRSPFHRAGCDATLGCRRLPGAGGAPGMADHDARLVAYFAHR